MLKDLEARCLPIESEVTGTRIGIGVASGADKIFVVKSAPDVESERLLPMAMAYDLEDGKVNWSGHHLVNPWNAAGLVSLAKFPGFAA